MKINLSNNTWRLMLILYFGGIFLVSGADYDIDKTTGLPTHITNRLSMTFQTIVDSTKAKKNDAEKAKMVSYDYDSQKKQLVKELLKVLVDPNTSKLNHGMAAYYLGEFNAVNSTDILAQDISLKLDVEDYGFFQGLPLVSGFTARDALVKIGTPSIPAVIRNLAESDDAKVRELSLQVVKRIDNDQDISALRLQKAIKAEKDSRKQARLQAALEALAETSSGH